MTRLDLLSGLLLPVLGGLIAGFLLGLTTGIIATLIWEARHRKGEDHVPTYIDATNPTPGKRPWHGSEHLSRLGWVLTVLGVLGVLFGAISLYSNSRTANCLADANTRFIEVLRQRDAADDLERQAIRQHRAVIREDYQALVSEIHNWPTDPAAQEKAKADFQAHAQDRDAHLADLDRIDEAADQQRRSHPLPEPAHCG